MNRLTFYSITASLACLAAPALADSQPIVVEPAPETQQWLEQVSETLNDRMSSGTGISKIQRRDGVVQIIFETGPDGRPVNAEYLTKSGNFPLDRAAWRAVAGLRNLHELPPEYAGRTAFQANIVHASSQRSYDHQMAELDRRLDEQRIASSGTRREVLAFNTVIRPKG